MIGGLSSKLEFGGKRSLLRARLRFDVGTHWSGEGLGKEATRSS